MVLEGDGGRFLVKNLVIYGFTDALPYWQLK